jgi:hypothetical protein
MIIAEFPNAIETWLSVHLFGLVESPARVGQARG